MQFAICSVHCALIYRVFCKAVFLQCTVVPSVHWNIVQSNLQDLFEKSAQYFWSDNAIYWALGCIEVWNARMQCPLFSVALRQRVQQCGGLSVTNNLSTLHSKATAQPLLLYGCWWSWHWGWWIWNDNDFWWAHQLDVKQIKVQDCSAATAFPQINQSITHDYCFIWAGM